MGKVLCGYTVALSGLFALSSAATSLGATLWGFGAIHSVCAAGVLALWWWEGRQYLQGGAGQISSADISTSFAPPVPAQLVFAQEGLLLPAHEPSPEGEALRTLESRAAALTERVSAVYPLVPREDIHKIVWMAMIEMYHKRRTESEAIGSETARRAAQTKRAMG